MAPNVLGVMAGGALGALARYLVTVAVGRSSVATLLVNVAGSFLLAFLVTLAARERLSPLWLLTLGTGFTGAFTTFSTFELDADALLRREGLGAALLYVGGNLFLGYGALLLGRLAATRL